MSEKAHRPSIANLATRIAALPPAERQRFERLFHVSTTVGETVPPEAMHAWIAGHFGSVDSVRKQLIVKITNRVTLDGAIFNELRARRPIEAPHGDQDLEETIAQGLDGPFCRPEQGTPADTFGRMRGSFCQTASNVAKYDGWHSVIIFDEHHPLRFTAEQVADYVEIAQAWAARTHEVDPHACYPFFLWNCLWRSGASILHGHAQMALSRDSHYAKIEAWRQAAQRYRAAYGSDYFSELVTVHRALELAVPHGTATILPSLTPFKEKETLIIGRNLDDDLKSALYRVLSGFVERLGVQSFNVGLYQPPLADETKEWQEFPYIFRVVDRGGLQSKTSDVGAMEIFAQSVITTDPYRVVDALRAQLHSSGV